MELSALAAALNPVMPTPELTLLADLLASPVRIAVIGRTSAGKSLAINRLTGSDRPTGLGGVTREPAEVDHEGRTFIDTPGIDGRDTAIDALGPIVDGCDAVLWVVDGLQPVTRTEREVLELLLPPSLPVMVFVSRCDLLGDDEDSVIGRVRQLTEPMHPIDVRGLDLRNAPVPVIPTLPTSPRRERAIDHALAELSRRFATYDPPVPAARLLGLCDVRTPVKLALTRIESGRTVADQVAAFGVEMNAVRDDLVVQIAAERALRHRLAHLPDLPPIPAATSGPLDGLRLGAAGIGGAARELRGLAAGWAAEATLCLADWAESIPTDDVGAAAWAVAQDALRRTETARRTARSA